MTPRYPGARRTLLGEEWFRNNVVPVGAGPVQIENARRAFYAGALAFYRCSAPGPADVDVDVMRRLESLLGELGACCKELSADAQKERAADADPA
jgi:hypothetical protein